MWPLWEGKLEKEKRQNRERREGNLKEREGKKLPQRTSLMGSIISRKVQVESKNNKTYIDGREETKKEEGIKE